MKEVTRVELMGLLVFDRSILLVRQKKGPLNGLLDLPEVKLTLEKHLKRH